MLWNINIILDENNNIEKKIIKHIDINTCMHISISPTSFLYTYQIRLSPLNKLRYEIIHVIQFPIQIIIFFSWTAGMTDMFLYFRPTHRPSEVPPHTYNPTSLNFLIWSSHSVTRIQSRLMIIPSLPTLLLFAFCWKHYMLNLFIA